MEILSTGEKIKRARIYKGSTLKDICEDKISVSKMSCIENGKIKPEPWILEFIAKKLDLDIDYLMKDVREQIVTSISELEKCKFSQDLEQKLQYILEYSLEYEYYDLAFKIMHLLFEAYLEAEKFEYIQIITSKYYEFCQKSKDDNNQLIYYKDMAKYLYMNEEYLQASTYYNSVRKTLREKDIKDYDMLTSVIFNEAACYMMLDDYERAYEIAIRLIDLLPHVDEDFKKACIYHLLAILSLNMGKDNFEEYETKAYEYYGKDDSKVADALLNYAIIMFKTNMEDKAISYLKRGLDIYPKYNREALVGYMLRCIDEMISYNMLEEAEEISDEALNNAIGCDNIKFIERAYYFKSLILERKGKYEQAETYMNLSLDALFKFGSKQERYKRYMEMGNMYYKLGEISESIKYFTLAMNIEKKM